MTTTTAAPGTAPAESHGDATRGLVGAGIAVCAWSTGTVLTKYIDMGGLAIGSYRFAMFAVLILVWMRVRGTPMTIRALRASFWGGLALGADIALFFSAVKLTSVVNATIIGSLQPILVGVVAARFFGEKIRRSDALLSMVALAGVIAIVAASADKDVTDIRGDLLAAGALLSWSGYFIASKQSKQSMSPTEFTAGTSIWAAIICTPLAFAFSQDMSVPSLRNVGLLLVMLASSGIIGHALMNWSLVRIPLWIGSTFTLLIPVFSALFAWALLGEAIRPIQGAAMAVVLGALAVVVRNQSTRRAPDAQTRPATAGS